MSTNSAAIRLKELTPVGSLPERLNVMFCLTKSELSHYPNLAGNEILCQNGREEAGSFHLAMGRKIDDLPARKRAAKDVQTRLRPVRNSPCAFAGTLTLHLPDGQPMVALYREVGRCRNRIMQWAKDQNAIVVCSSHYARAGQEPHLLVLAYPADPRMSGPEWKNSFQQSFRNLLEG